MNISNLNQRILIIKKNLGTDEDGYKTEIYEEIYKCWANINNLYGKELYNAYTIGLENTLNVKIRYCKLLKEIFLDNDNKNRDYKLKWNNTIFDISLVDFLGFKKDYIILKVRKLD